MQVMVMNDDPAVQIRLTKGLMSKGFQVVSMETITRACAYVKIDPVDILITGERIGGRLSHAVALAAECANPMVTTMLLTERTDPEIEELYELLPSLYALISPRSDPAVVARLALSAVANSEDAERRMHRNAQARQMRPLADWAAVFQDTSALKPAPRSGRGQDMTGEGMIEEDVPEEDMADGYDLDALDATDGFDDPETFDQVPEPAVENVFETASWGHEDEVCALADAAALPEQETGFTPMSDAAPTAKTAPQTEAPIVSRTFASALADLLREETEEPADAAMTEARTARPVNPLFGPRGQSDSLPQTRSVSVAAASRPPMQVAAPVTVPGTMPALARPAQASVPEVVPPRPNRSDWIAAKVRELEGPEVRARLHLA